MRRSPLAGGGGPCERALLSRTPYDRPFNVPHSPNPTLEVRTVVCELLHQMGELRRRIEVLEGCWHTELPHSAEVEKPLRANECSPSYDGASGHHPNTPDEDGRGEAATLREQRDGITLTDLPNGPVKIDLAARALGRTPRTLRGWCQVKKYDLPCHKEAGRWHFYRDELEAWYSDYEAKSQRDSKRAQARRRRTKNGKQTQ